MRLPRAFIFINYAALVCVIWPLGLLRFIVATTLIVAFYFSTVASTLDRVWTGEYREDWRGVR